MSSVDELMKLAGRWAQACANGYSDRESETHDRFMHALTATLFEKDARIAELEAHIKDLLDDEIPASNDEQAFLDAAAIACMAAEVGRVGVEEVSDNAVDTALELAALLAERRKRMVRS
jgi:hypothetical protein